MSQNSKVFFYRDINGLFFYSINMTDGYKQQLESIGVDLERAIDRFVGNEAMYERFLLRFLQDESYMKLNEYINKGDIHQAFVQAHTLKGVAGNLEFHGLYRVLEPMTEHLRNNDLSTLPEEVELLKVRYEEVCRVIAGNK